MEKAEPPKGNKTDRVSANINRCMLILLCASDHLEKVDEWGGEERRKMMDKGQEDGELFKILPFSPFFLCRKDTKFLRQKVR